METTKLVTQDASLQVVNSLEADIKLARKEGLEHIHVEEIQGSQYVDARALHKFLGSRRDFSNWVKERIEHCDLVENVDYEVFNKFVENSKGGRPRIDYRLSISAAKEISMVEGTLRGKLARRYFIVCEEKLKQIMRQPSYKIEDPIARARKWANEQEQNMRRVQGLQMQIEAQQPKVQFLDKVLLSETCYTSTQMAKELGITSALTLHQKLKDAGIMFKQSFQWMLTSKFSEFGYTQCRTHLHIAEGNTTVTKTYTVWTEKGRMFLHELKNTGKI